MKLRALRYTLLLVALFGISFLLRASLPSVATGTWVAAGNMSAARSGACTVVLSDGRLLVSGGADANGPTATADLFSTTGSWSAAASMNSPRSHQSCAVLQDGRVLVAGGTTSGGGITNSAEIYDPSADSWAQAGLMNDARSGATASVLQDGRVLIAGGQNSGGASNTLEIFDPISGNFSNAGTLSSPRQDYAAAVLSDGRVLIVGGSSDGTNALNTTDIYDPQAGSVSPGPAMSTPRAKATATTLLDGTVVVIGGSNGTSDLASAEFLDPAANNFNAAGSLTIARSKHSAFLLPNNNEVLVVGGQAAGNDLASAELYIPWQKAFQATGAMATPRSDATGAALTAVDGRLLIAGGSSTSAELYGFATVKTDRQDYAPGETVTITGSGWQPGETVTLTLVETPLIDTHPTLTAVADGNGNIVNSQFVPDIHDFSVKFYLTASASQSQAQTTFTDAGNASDGDGTMGVSPATVTAESTGNTLTFTFGAPNSKDFNAGSQATIQVPAGWTTPTTSNVAVAVGPSPACNSASLTSVTGGIITVTMNCTAKQQFTVTYSGVTAPAAGSYTFTTKTKQSGGALTALTTTPGSPVVTVNNPAPTTTTISPSTKNAGDAAFTLTVNGTNFVHASTVNFNGSPRTTTFVSSTQLTAAITAADVAIGGSFPVTVINPAPGGGTSNPQVLTVNNPVPTTTSISPTSKNVGDAAFTMTVNGTNFVSTSVVNFNGSLRTTTFVNSTQVTASIPAGDLTTGGTFNITVVNPTPGGGTSNAQTFTVNNQGPTTTSISPTSVTAGAAAFTLTVNGTNFASNSVVNFNGSARTTTFVSSTQVTASINAADIASAGTFPITVTNPAPGGGTSNTQTLTVNNPVPTTTTISPVSKNLGDAAFTLTVNGTNFVSTSVVNFAGSARTTTFVSATQLTASIPASDLTTAGTFNITVTNPTPGGGTSNAQTLTVNNPAPTTTTISPTSKNVGDAAFTLTVNGTNFLSNSVVNFAGSARTTTFVSSTQVTASIPASDLTTAGTFNITVTNPAPGGGTSNAQVFTVNNATPTTTSISPTSKSVTDAAFTLTVNGTNFVSNSAVNFNGSARTTAFVSATQLTAAIPATDLVTAGTFNITVTNPAPGGGNSNAQTFTVNPKLVITSNAFGVITGICSSQVTVQTQNQNNSAANQTPGITLNLSSNSANGKFFSDPACSAPNQIINTQIASGSSTASFFYSDTTSGAPTITVASTGLTSATQTEAIDTLRFQGTAFSVQTNQCSTGIVIQAVNPNPTALTQSTTIALSSSSAGGKFYSDAGCTAQITSTTIAPGIDGGHDTNSFFYKDTAAGTPTLTASVGTASVQQAESVIAAPSISKAFGAAAIPVNGTTSLTFTITNPAANAVALTGAAFTDTFPAGLVVATPNGLSSTCGGTTTATAGSGSVSLTGGTVAINSSCTISVNVKATTSGTKNNTTGAVTSTNGGTGNTASASITVATPPTISKAFGTASIPLNASTSLTFTINNPNTTSLSGVAFTDNLPAGLVVANPNNLSSTCSGTTTATAGSGSISLSAGTLAASGSCTISLNVAGTTTGVKNNTTGAITSTESGPGATSNTATLNVNARTTSTSISPLTATAAIGQGANFTVTVTDTDSGTASTPTGTVTVSSSNGADTIGGCTLAQTVVGTATCTATVTPAAPTGTHTISASYVASDNVHANSSTATNAALTVTNPATTTQVVSSQNPSTFGQSVMFTATVSSAAGTPTGSVTFYDGGASCSTPGTALGAAVVLNASGIAGLSTSALTGGSHTVLACYTPTGIYNASSGSVTQQVTQATPTVSFTGAPASAYFNSQFTVSATTNASTTPTITASGACTISGTTVTMTSGTGTCSPQASWAADINYVAATATQSTNALQVPVSVTVPDTTVTYDGTPKSVTPTVAPAVAYAVTYTGISPTVYTTSSSAPTEPGSYTVVAAVTDPNYTGSGSGTLTISKKDPALSLTLLTGMPEPSTYGTRVYFELTTANSPCPTGEAQFFVDGDGTPSSTVTLSNSPCTKQPIEFSTATLTPGTHSVYAVYGGDTYYVNQTSAKVSHEVIADGTTVTLATSATEVFVGDAVTLTATVTPSNSIDGSATAPSGTVQFYDNTTTLLGETTLSSNTATFTLSSLPAGSHSITATYVSANGDFGGSSSPVSMETVDKITPTITWPNPADIIYGTKLSATQLNAKATDEHNSGVPVSGTFVYDPALDTLLAVGSRNLTVTFTPDDTATYGTQTATVTINVTAATLTVTADDTSRYYGTDNPTFTFKYSGFVNSETVAVVSPEPTCTSSASTTSKVGTYPITCSGGVSPNYTFKYADGTLTVNPALLTITANDTTKTYGDTVTFAGTEFATSGLVNGDAVSSVTLTSAGAAAVATVAGSPYAITPSAALGTGLTNYTITYKDGKLTVNQAPLTVTAADANRLYGDPNPAFTGTITGIKNADNITATYASAATSASPVGTYPIVPTLVDPDHKLGNYMVTSNNGKLTINPAPLTVTAADANRLYGDPNPVFTGTITGIKNADNITATYASAATAASPVGTYPIVPTLVDPDHKLGNYIVTSNNGKLTVNPAPLTVTAADANRLYGDPNPAFTGTITGIKNADNITATYASAATAASPVGTYPIVPTLVDPDNKLGNYAVTSNNGKLTVNPAPLTVTAADANRLYGDPNPAFTGTITGIKNADNITATYASVATAASPVGTYPIVPILVDPDHKLGNYVVASNNGKLTVNPAPLSVVVDAKTKIYGDSNPALTGTLSGVKNSDNINASYSTAATAASAVGQYDITASLNDPDGKLGNYTVTNTPAKLTINPAPLTVTAADANRLYGDPNPAFTGTITGIKNADNITATYASVATAASPVGTYPIVPTLVDPDHKLGNYAVASNNGKLTVNPALLSVVVDGKNKVYGDSNPALTGTLTGVKNSDNITASYSTAATAASAIGQYDITATLNDPDGKLGNYSVTNTSAKLSVAPASLTVTPANANRLYGDANPAFTGTITGIKNGDNISASYTSAAAPASPIGAYPITATLNDPTNKLGNYTVTLNNGTLTVNPAPLTVTPANASRLYGSANPAFTGAIVGIKNGDPITASYGTTATQSSSVGSYDITATLSDPANKLSNYTVTLNKGTLTINSAPLTITADKKSKFLNAVNPPLTATYSGFVLGQDPSALSGTLTCTTTATTNSPVGSYPINCSGQTSTNYAITYVPGALTITYVTSGMCAGDIGHQIRQPINADGSSVWKQGSTVPAKFAVCDANGVSIGTPGVVTSFNLVAIIHGTTTTVDEAPASTTPDTAFRWDPTGQQWIFNISTKSAPVNVANQTYMFQILLNDGSTINFQFGLK